MFSGWSMPKIHSDWLNYVTEYLDENLQKRCWMDWPYVTDMTNQLLQYPPHSHDLSPCEAIVKDKVLLK